MGCSDLLLCKQPMAKAFFVAAPCALIRKFAITENDNSGFFILCAVKPKAQHHSAILLRNYYVIIY